MSTLLSETILHAHSASGHEWTGITVLQASADPFTQGWRPAVNAYRCADKFVVFVDAAGVPLEAVEVSAESQRLLIHGRRLPPAPGCEPSKLNQLLALEIDHGPFERVLDLPHPVDPRRMTVDSRNGLLRIQLPLAG